MGFCPSSSRSDECGHPPDQVGPRAPHEADAGPDLWRLQLVLGRVQAAEQVDILGGGGAKLHGVEQQGPGVEASAGRGDDGGDGERHHEEPDQREVGGCQEGAGQEVEQDAKRDQDKGELSQEQVVNISMIDTLINF